MIKPWQSRPEWTRDNDSEQAQLAEIADLRKQHDADVELLRELSHYIGSFLGFDSKTSLNLQARLEKEA
jgi:hypothetical protein